jgi:hypothetical protein
VSKTTYDRIGVGYANTRRADPQIASVFFATELDPHRPK